MSAISETVSRLPSVPILHWLKPGAPARLKVEELEGFLACQRLAQASVKEVAGMMREGWTERHAADLVNAYLQDSGVSAFFHKAFAWFGERARFDAIEGYGAFSPSNRVLRPGEVFILDVAPIYHGYVSDIGYTASLGPNAELDKARAFLLEIRREIPKLFEAAPNGGEVCRQVDLRIAQAGYEPVHHRYPFAVLGHRVHSKVSGGKASWWNFGWQSYWELASRGVFGQLLNVNYRGRLDGLWAVEPHIGSGAFGAKFEEILCFEDGKARWLENEVGW